ncbi:MAG TPA: bifunctional transaldolase/phosoglucose isomerase [Stellaceae bacterium]
MRHDTNLRFTETLGAAETKALAAALADWTQAGKIGKLWARDKSLWTGADENKWLGWLDIVTRERRDVATLDNLKSEAARYADIVLIGMGGSSLGPDVIARSFSRIAGHPRFHMLDSTDPAQIATLEGAIDPARTLFIVSSKSGTTLEPNILEDYFFERAGKIGKQFVAVTDPGSAMEGKARERGFAHVFFGDATIGGRYSVLSKFGLVPAAALGVDVAAVLDATETMARLCQGAGEGNPALRLGLTLGVLATQFRRDKVTILASPGLASLGSWLEQLFAESTGKEGKGLIPVDGEPVAAPADYGNDRVFLYVALSSDDDDSQANAIEVLALAGHPVIRLQLDDVMQLGQVFFLAEVATAVAGAVIGIDPFDQPDVEASKLKTRALTDAYEKSGKLPEDKPFVAADGVALFADPENAAALAGGTTLVDILRAHFARAAAGDYLAVLAYIERNDAHTARLTALRVALRHATRCATCVGFGPRFLHSTGQAYKGGPNSGVFLQITADPPRDLAVPGKKYSFAVVEAAQAQGDLAVLTERKRRALRVHLSDVETGLDTLTRAIHAAVAR